MAQQIANKGQIAGHSGTVMSRSFINGKTRSISVLLLFAVSYQKSYLEPRQALLGSCSWPSSRMREGEGDDLILLLHPFIALPSITEERERARPRASFLVMKQAVCFSFVPLLLPVARLTGSFCSRTLTLCTFNHRFLYFNPQKHTREEKRTQKCH